MKRQSKVDKYMQLWRELISKDREHDAILVIEKIDKLLDSMNRREREELVNSCGSYKKFFEELAAGDALAHYRVNER